MARLAGTTLLFVASFAIACDSASEHEGCIDPADRSKPGPDPSQCPRSTFPEQGFRALEVSGIVRRGEDPVAGAQVHVTPAPDTTTLAGSPPFDTTSDVAGFFRVASSVPKRYDLSFRLPGGLDGRDDVLVYRSVGGRYLEPHLDLPVRTLATAWVARVDVRLATPLAAGQALRFLAAGDGVVGVTGDAASGLFVHTTRYTATATLHAIAYDAARGLNSATAYAKVDVITDAANPKVLALHLEPLTGERPTPTFELEEAPPGFVPGDVVVRIGVGRTSDAVLVSIPWGTTTSLAPIPNQSFTYQLRATRADGAISDSGETGFDIGALTKIKLVAPPEVTAPADGATIGPGDLLGAGGPGVIEHVFEPASATGAGMHIVQRLGPETPLPDPRPLGVSTLAGTYTWTVRSFPNLTWVENVWGPDGRRYRPFAISPPRTITIR
ncbi:MAG: carboxypeptidase regulatory-like domain-containing protein [Labilithrix sp.]|nr:carboxypeptidase regulatory-like domain-containing protein [Labilithrix sp.]MCW5817591.1 carboxypeptidase regulatory-like domain-containing protein [Labilithrix sp.]